MGQVLEASIDLEKARQEDLKKNISSFKILPIILKQGGEYTPSPTFLSFLPPRSPALYFCPLLKVFFLLSLSPSLFFIIPFPSSISLLHSSTSPPPVPILCLTETNTIELQFQLFMGSIDVSSRC